MKINGIILAGGSVDEKLKTRTDVNDEALIPIGQHIMVEYVVGAMKNSNFVEKIAVAGPVEQLRERVEEDSNLVLVPGETVAGSVVNGLAVLPPSEFCTRCQQRYSLTVQLQSDGLLEHVWRQEGRFLLSHC